MDFVLVCKHLRPVPNPRKQRAQILLGLGTRIFAWFVIQVNTLYVQAQCTPFHLGVELAPSVGRLGFYAPQLWATPMISPSWWWQSLQFEVCAPPDQNKKTKRRQILKIAATCIGQFFDEIHDAKAASNPKNYSGRTPEVP